jgi:cytochrome c oxidase subunit II
MDRAARVICFLAVSALIGGCGGKQSTLNPQSEQSRQISTLWWWMLVVAGIVFLGAVGMLLLGWLRRKPGLPFFGEREGISMGLVVVFGFALPVVVLVALFIVANLVVIKTTSAPAARSTALTIKVIGHQWFWEVRYHGTPAITANEIHIPAATPVDVRVTTADVIHSFWVPRLNRKIDMIPGKVNRIELDAPDPGVYRGQCSEFCGVGHAQMAFDVIVQPPAQFQAWLRNQAQPAARPSGAAATQGLHAFMTAGCQDCHAIRGTSASGHVGPDLTHVGSRRTLAALTIPNTPPSLFEWITNPQRIKPGARMPGFASLPATERHALVTYLEGLR